MGRPVAAFLDEVDDFLNREYLPEAYTDVSYFDQAEIRVNYDEERLKIRGLSFCERNPDDHIQRVNKVLDQTEIRIEFQFHGDEVTGSWTEGLAQFTVGVHLPDINPPAVLKWEGRDGRSGVLKADEWMDQDREYITCEITARAALARALDEHLEVTIPGLRDRSVSEPIPPILVKTLFNEDHEILQSLRPVDDS